MERKTILKQGPRLALAACGLLIGASMMQSCKDEVLTGQPSWLGNSIYERLQEDGTYTTTLKLIDDLGQHEVMSHTGSKTLFAANDEAYAEWFRTNTWGVRSYDDLTTSQKKLLLNNSMINNAYLIELLSNVSGTPPVEGRCMRRETASSIYDSVYVMPASEMPNTKAWADYKSRGKSMPILKDGTSAPMIHFLPAFMKYYQITDEDLRIMTNGQANSVSEAWVNGKKVVEQDITCKNGYIHKVDGVIESSPNMAEIIRQTPQMSMWSSLLDRYSAPYYNAAGTREYNRMYNNEDSVFTLRYFSKWAQGNDANNSMPDGTRIANTELLSFDPGWNQYMYSNTMDYDLHYDAGVMIVPTNEALQAWWDGDGRDLKDEYKTWDSIPNNTLAKLLNVNMLPTLTGAIPSKFDQVLNDAKEPLGIKPEDVVACYMGCNGVVYLTNKVFTPAEYASVAYPALAHASTMNIIYWVIDERTFLPYLLSMDSRYSLILPNNDAMMVYLDPGSYGKAADVTGEDGTTTRYETPDLIEFRWDVNTKSVKASRYTTTVDANGNIVKGQRTQADLASAVINKMADDLMNQLIIVGDIEDGHEFYKTKGGTLLRVTRENGQLFVEGGWQMEHNHAKIPITATYPKTNGRSYQVETTVPLGAQKSLYMTLKEHSEYSNFQALLDNDYCTLLKNKLSNKYNPGNAAIENKNMGLFDNYNYTVFIPTNASIQQLWDSKVLPTPEELEEERVDESGRTIDVLDSICIAEGWPNSEADKKKIKTYIGNIVSDFIRYHVMDRSVAIGMAPEATQQGNYYESMKRNPETGRFFPLEVEFDDNKLEVKDVMGNTRTVQKTQGLYNNICREYWFEGSNNTARLFMGSDAVVHLIDQPLLYENLKPWRQVVKEYLGL